MELCKKCFDALLCDSPPDPENVGNDQPEDVVLDDITGLENRCDISDAAFERTVRKRQKIDVQRIRLDVADSISEAADKELRNHFQMIDLMIVELEDALKRGRQMVDEVNRKKMILQALGAQELVAGRELNERTVPLESCMRG